MLEKILGTSEKVGATSCANKEEFLEIAAGNSFLDGLFTFFRKVAENIQRSLSRTERGACIFRL